MHRKCVHFSIKWFSTSSKLSDENLVEKLKPEVTQKDEYEPGDISKLITAFAKLALPRYLGFEQNNFPDKKVSRKGTVVD